VPADARIGEGARPEREASPGAAIDLGRRVSAVLRMKSELDLPRHIRAER